MAHRKTVRHFHETGHLHELTFSCYRRMPLLTNDVWREKLARCVEAAGKEWMVQLVGFVFMPEHVHLPHTTTPSAASFVVVPWTGNGRRLGISTVFHHDSNIPTYR